MTLRTGRTNKVYRLTDGNKHSIEYGKFTILLDDLKERIEVFDEPVSSFKIEEIIADEYGNIISKKSLMDAS